MNMERCSFCGYEFKIEEAKVGCNGCPMGNSCGKIKCPKCNYEMPSAPNTPIYIRKIKELFNIKRDIGKDSLLSLKVGEKAVIKEIQTNDASKLQKLMSFGLLPGAEVKIIKKYPAIVIEEGFTQIAVDDNIAEYIIIEKNIC